MDDDRLKEYVGVHDEMPADQYHESPGYSSTLIKAMTMQTPAHAFAKHLDPDRVEPQKRHFDFGQADHCLKLEPHLFPKQFIIEPDPASRDDVLDSATALKKECASRGCKVGGGKIELATRLAEETDIDQDRLWPLVMQSFEDMIDGRIVLKPGDGKALLAMARAYRAHPAAMQFTRDGFYEHSIYWIDEETGLLLKVRPDIWVPHSHLTDNKTSRDASLAHFQRDAFRLGYHIQAAMYLDGMKHGADQDLGDEFYFVAQEKELPYAVGVFQLDVDLLDMGRAEYRRGVRELAQCLEDDHWPAYSPDVQTLFLPNWAQAQFDKQFPTIMETIDV